MKSFILRTVRQDVLQTSRLLERSLNFIFKHDFKQLNSLTVLTKPCLLKKIN